MTPNLFRAIVGSIAKRIASTRRASAGDAGSTTVETVIIVAAMAAIAIAAMAAIAAAVDAKVGGLQL